MNGNPTVDPDLAARVRELAAWMNYRPSMAARSLSLGRTHTAAVIVPDLGNPNYQEVLRGVAAAAEDASYRILVAETRDAAAHEEGVVLDARERCDAVVLVAPRMPESRLRPLPARVAPAVVVSRDADDATVDQAQLGRLAWRQLQAVLGGERLADPAPVRPRLTIRNSTGAVPAAIRLAHGENP